MPTPRIEERLTAGLGPAGEAHDVSPDSDLGKVIQSPEFQAMLDDRPKQLDLLDRAPAAQAKKGRGKLLKLPLCDGCGKKNCLGTVYCPAAKRRQGLINASLRLRKLVRHCASCRSLRLGMPELRRLLLGHEYDAGAAIASLARYPGPELRYLRVHLWRCLLGDPLWDIRRDPWAGREEG